MLARLSVIILFFSFSVHSQVQLNGVVLDENKTPLSGAHIYFSKAYEYSDNNGKFSFQNLDKDTYKLHAGYVGYKSFDTIIRLETNSFLEIRLQRDGELEEVILTKKLSSEIFNVDRVDSQFIEENFSGSLAKSLERIPGVNSIEIGAGASKPIIRGLSFNRIVVAENGSRHEGQQWGADHGLEIDALAIEDIEIIKSVGTIAYGSDAIGGVVKINSNSTPSYEGWQGSYKVFGRSVNQTIANSIDLAYKKKNYFLKFKSSISDYGDYNLPTDRIRYLSVNMPVENNRLKNTAGRERNFMLQGGYRSDNFNSTLSISNTYLKAGFFPGAHGVPSIARVQDDGDRRNIDFPYQRVNHFKVNSENKWVFEQSDFSLDLSYQNNHRQEWSLFHTHYVGQQRPEVNPNLELNFDLHTFEARAQYDYYFSKKHHTSIGLQTQYQDNGIKGFNFLLPNYTRTSAGLYAIHEYEFNDKLGFNFGLRTDYAEISIDEFYDPLLFEYLEDRGSSPEEAENLATRSQDTNREFSNINVLLGASYEVNPHFNLSLTTGTNFRLPSPIELAANGIHHGSFRHEQGNPALNPEQGFVVDAKATYVKENYTLSFSPYTYFFSNYIFLNPSGVFSTLPHGGQIYRFTESEAVMAGFEVFYEHEINTRWKTSLSFEYLWNQQITDNNTKNYPLPFSPPINGFGEITYKTNPVGIFSAIELYANSNLVAKQNRTAQNEEETPGYAIFGGGARTNLKIGKFKASLNLQMVNLFDEKYFNHTNFYRALEIPEMGRNIQLMINIPLFNNG